MPGKGPGPSIKNPDQYEAVKKAVAKDHPDWPPDKVKEHAARISNASANAKHMNTFMRGGKRGAAH